METDEEILWGAWMGVPKFYEGEALEKLLSDSLASLERRYGQKIHLLDLCMARPGVERLAIVNAWAARNGIKIRILPWREANRRLKIEVAARKVGRLK